MPTDDVQTDGATQEGGAQATDKGTAGILEDLRKTRERAQAAEKRIADIEAAAAEAKRKADEETGNYRKLYEDLKPAHEAATAKLTAAEQREQARTEALTAKNDARIATLPEAYRGLVPDGLDQDARATQIERIEAIAKAQQFPAGTGVGGGSGKGGKAAPIPDELRAYAAQLGKKTDEQIETIRTAWLLTPAGKAFKARTTGA